MTRDVDPAQSLTLFQKILTKFERFYLYIYRSPCDALRIKKDKTEGRHYRRRRGIKCRLVRVECPLFRSDRLDNSNSALFYPLSVLRVRNVYPGSWVCFHPGFKILDLGSRIQNLTTTKKRMGKKLSLFFCSSINFTLLIF